VSLTNSGGHRRVLCWCFLVDLQDPERASELDQQAEDAYNRLMDVVSSPTPEVPAASSTAYQQQEQSEQEGKIYAVYLPATPEAAPSSTSQFVELLRLPEQAEEYSRALQQSMLVVPLPGAAVEHAYGTKAVSAEQLSWQAQQDAKELQQEQQDCQCNTHGMDASTNDSFESSNSKIKVSTGAVRCSAKRMPHIC
jgi:hypothetical protein